MGGRRGAQHCSLLVARSIARDLPMPIPAILQRALRAKASSWLYVIGTLFLLPGTILLLDRFAHLYDEGINWLVAATSCLTLAAAIDYLAAWLEPSVEAVAIEQSEKDPLGLEQPLAPTPGKSTRQLLVPHMMLQGGVLFLIASCMYLPAVAKKALLHTTVANMGTWVFRVGTLSYLCGSFGTLRDIHRTPAGLYGASRSLLAGVGCFIVGALLYLCGGILSQLSLAGFAETWVAGSVCFSVGAMAFLIS